MDIIVRSVLQHIQQTQPESVVAGGSVRDDFLGLTPKDYDIFVPIKKKIEMGTIVTSLVDEFKVSLRQKGQHYEQAGGMRHLSSVYAFELENKRFDIIGVDIELDETEVFADKVIETFDYGINMAYDTGSYVNADNPKFVADIEYQEMSLHKLDSISHLPNSIARFNAFNDKYIQRFNHPLIFRAPCLELIGQEKGRMKVKKRYPANPVGEIPLPVGWQQPAPANFWIDEVPQVQAMQAQVIGNLNNNF